MTAKEHTISVSARSLRVSPRKLNLVAEVIRNVKANTAVHQLQFSKKRIALDVRKCLMSAISNAEHNHGINSDELVVSSATVGKAACMDRIRSRAKGRSSPIKKFFSHLYITLKQRG
jgi:large subunit ribosomal protein L22